MSHEQQACARPSTIAGHVCDPDPCDSGFVPNLNLFALHPSTLSIIGFVKGALHVLTFVLVFSLFTSLGFDPWNECSKGLADLLQEEEKTTEPDSAPHISTASHTHSFLSAFPADVSAGQAA